jgi:hypothetical protein
LSIEQAAQTRPQGRYGTTQGAKPARWRRWVFLLIALVVSGAVAYVAYRNLGAAPIDAQRVGFVAEPGNAMQITIAVTRDEPAHPGVCIVQAFDLSGAESGRKEVLVPPGSESMSVSTVIQSIGKPVTADVFGCSYDVPRYLSSP